MPKIDQTPATTAMATYQEGVWEAVVWVPDLQTGKTAKVYTIEPHGEPIEQTLSYNTSMYLNTAVMIGAVRTVKAGEYPFKALRSYLNLQSDAQKALTYFLTWLDSDFSDKLRNKSAGFAEHFFGDDKIYQRVRKVILSRPPEGFDLDVSYVPEGGRAGALLSELKAKYPR